MFTRMTVMTYKVKIIKDFTGCYIFRTINCLIHWFSQLLCPPIEDVGGILFCKCRSVGRSVCLSVGPPNVVRMITQERLVLGSWNFIGSLVMMSRGSLLFLRSVGQRSRSPGHGNIKCCPDDNSRTLGPRIMKLHRELGYDEQRKPIGFWGQ